MDRDETEIDRWTVEESERLADCRVFAVERRRMRRGDGRADDFFVIRSPDWVNVVALTGEDERVLVEQWRHGVEKVTLEIPGGMVDPGESPYRAAVRELREETGYTAREWYGLGWVEPNPAIQTNRCHTFLARGAEPAGRPSFDRNERCRLVLRPFSEAGRLVAEGIIDHALVVVALHRESLRRAGVLAPSKPTAEESQA